MKEQNPICKQEIQRNIIAVDTRQPLTRSLKELNQSCEFKSHWDKFCKKVYGDDDRKAYYQKHREEILNKLHSKRL